MKWKVFPVFLLLVFLISEKTFAENVLQLPLPINYKVTRIDPNKHFEPVPFNKPGGGQGIALIPDRGAISPEDVAVVINTQEPYSVEVGEYYAFRYGIPEKNIIRVSFNSEWITTVRFFSPVLKEIKSKIPANAQVLVISFTRPLQLYVCEHEIVSHAAGNNIILPGVAVSTNYVECNPKTSGLDPTILDLPSSNMLEGGHTANVFEMSPRPRDDFKYMPSAVLLASNAVNAKAVIDRGFNSRATYPSGTSYLTSSRYIREIEFDGDKFGFANSWNHPGGLKTEIFDSLLKNYIKGKTDVFLYSFWGSLNDTTEHLQNTFLPGSIAIPGRTVLSTLAETDSDKVYKWVENGAGVAVAAVYHSAGYNLDVDVPLLTRAYFMGASAIEALSSAGLYHVASSNMIIGDPLARPFGPAQINFSGNQLVISTTSLFPNRRYIVMGGNDLGALTPVTSEFVPPKHMLYDIKISDSSKTYYKIVDLGAQNPTAITLNPLDSPGGIPLFGPWMCNNETLNVQIGNYQDAKFAKFLVDGRIAQHYPDFPSEKKGFYGKSIASIYLTEGNHEVTFRVIDKNHDVFELTQTMFNSTLKEKNAPIFNLSPYTNNSRLSDDARIDVQIDEEGCIDTSYAAIGYASNGRTHPILKSLIMSVPLSKKVSFTVKELMDMLFPNGAENTIKDGETMYMEVGGRDSSGLYGKTVLNFTYSKKGGGNSSPQGPDVLPPGKKLQILSPRKGDKVSDKITVEVLLDIKKAVASVDIIIDGKMMQQVKKVKKAKLKKNIKLKGISKGKHKIQVIIKYTDGTKAASSVKFSML